MRFWQVVISSGLILSSGLGLLIMSGSARGLFAPGLQAELVVQDFKLPPDMGVNPSVVADFMAQELQRRLGQDIAIRLTLPSGSMDKVRDIVLPRLMNVVAVQTMLEEIPDLSALLALNNIRQTISGKVISRNAASDVAITVPDALLASVDGRLVEITTTATGMTALSLGDMTAGQSYHVILWLGDAANEAALAKSILIGASGGERGRVLLGGDHGWFGADVEVLRWGRWLIGSVLAVVLLFGLSNLFLPLFENRTHSRS
ncbi:MAG: hypothetical protein ACO3U1_07855 [Marivivens sp.]